MASVWHSTPVDECQSRNFSRIVAVASEVTRILLPDFQCDLERVHLKPCQTTYARKGPYQHNYQQWCSNPQTIDCKFGAFTKWAFLRPHNMMGQPSKRYRGKNLDWSWHLNDIYPPALEPRCTHVNSPSPCYNSGPVASSADSKNKI